jgi:Zn ribbon nucleic-acid-binding protein
MLASRRIEVDIKVGGSMDGNGSVDADGFEVVATGFACPSCGERRLDYLTWLEPDFEVVRCTTCGAEYAPGVDRRAWLIEAVVRIGQSAGWWDDGTVTEWRRLADTLTVEQLDRWYRVSAWAAKVNRETQTKE